MSSFKRFFTLITPNGLSEFQHQMLVWLTCVFFNSYVLFANNSIVPFQAQIEFDLALSKTQFALLSSSAYAFIYTFGQLVNGFFINRYGFKSVMIFAALCCIQSNCILSYSDYYYFVLLARCLAAIGGVFSLITFVLLTRTFFSPNYQGALIGWGALVAGFSASFAFGVSHFWHGSWHSFYQILLIVSCCMTLAIATFIPNDLGAARPQSISLQSMSELLKDPYIFTLIIFCASIYSGIQYFSSNEIFIFLKLKSITPDGARTLMFASWIGYAIGCMLSGHFADRLKRPDHSLIGYSVACFICFLSIVYFKTRFALTLLFFFGLGVAASGIIIALTVLNVLLDNQRFTYATCMVNFSVGVVSMVNPPIVGMILDITSKQYGLLDLKVYQFAFLYLLCFMRSKVQFFCCF